MTGPRRPDRSVARLLCLHGATGRSGIVRAERGKLRRLFCLESGNLVFAASNLVEEQFGEFLVRTGILTPSERADLVARTREEKKKFGELILTSSGLDEATVRRAAGELAVELLSSTLEWPDGTARFEHGRPRLDGEVRFGLSPLDLILSHCRRFPMAIDAVRMRLGPPDLRLGPGADAKRLIEGLDLPDPLRRMYDRCDGATPLPVLLEGSQDPDAALRMLYALSLTGLVEPTKVKTRVASEAPLTREECLARLDAVATRDHYSVLGISRDASVDSIKAAYYTVARRYHPDRFRSGELQDLLPRFEEFFASVTEAHNTLSDPAQRSEYDRTAGISPPDTQKKDGSELARQNFLKGRSMVAQKRLTEALKFLENAVKQDARRPEYRLELGLLLARNPRRREDAEQQLLAALELSPSLGSAYRGLGEMYLRAGMTGPGCRLLREALRWDPGDREASSLLSEAAAQGAVPENTGELLRPRFRT